MIKIKTIQAENAGLHKNKSTYIHKGERLYSEQVVKQYYEDNDYDGALWSENDYWWTIMALLYWDIIFAKTYGAVVSGGEKLFPGDQEFDQLFKLFVEQNGQPADFGQPEFYEFRKNLIRNRFKELENTDIPRLVEEKYQQYKGLNCRPVNNWNKFSSKELSEPLKHLENETVNAILLRLIADFYGTRQGLPDIVAWESGDFVFSEVKSENDAISSEQKMWHLFISEVLGAQIEIVLINANQERVEKIKKTYSPLKQQVDISFGETTSKNKNKAIQILKQHDNFYKKETDSEIRYGAIIKCCQNNLDALIRVLKLTNRWKSQKVFVQGDKVDGTPFKNALRKYKERIFEFAGEPDDILQFTFHDSYGVKYGCADVRSRELSMGRWLECGYVDSQKEIWVFNNKQVQKLKKQATEIAQYCPMFLDKKMDEFIKNLPETVNPKKNLGWGFLDNEGRKWLWLNGAWITPWYTDKKFPGINHMVGVARVHNKERVRVREKELNQQVDAIDGSAEQLNTSKKKNSDALKIFGYVMLAIFGLAFWEISLPIIASYLIYLYLKTR